jgi:hypothetical protein
MASLFNELVYISLSEARDSSSILADITNDTELTTIITKSQYLIDAYLGSY